MVKVLRKLLVVTSCALLAFGCAYCVLNRETAKAENTVTVSIDYCNLAFENNVYILYAVNVSGSEEIPTLYIWEETANRTSENITATLTPYATEKIEQVDYYLFAYKNLAAKQMTDNVYAKASVTGAESKEIKYSILQYAENMKNSGNEKLDNLLTAMLEYGTMAQIFDGEGYKLDRLANAKYYSLTVENGTLFDGTSSGLFTATETVFVTAPEEMDGKVFNCWKDGDGNVVDVTNGIKLTANTTLTATYKSAFSEGLEYNLINDGAEYEVTGIGSCTDTELIIPEMYNGKPVTSIGYRAFYQCQFIESVTVANSITSVGTNAFAGCYKLVEVINLSSLKITKEREDNGCIGYYALNVKRSGTSDIVDIDGYQFYSYNSINYLLSCTNNDIELTLPDGFNGENYKIYQYAFADNENLIKVTIPNVVTEIGDSAFYACYSLQNVLIGNKVVTMGKKVFLACRSLTSITIPNSITSIGEDAFYECYKLVEVINLSKLSIATTSFGLYALKVKTSGASEIVNQNGYLFYTYNNINYLLGYVGNDTELTLPENYNGQNYEIYQYAFLDCDALTNVDMPSAVTSIGSYAFQNCDLLTSINIPNSVKSIGSFAFSYCDSLVSVTIGSGVTSIGSCVFRSCGSLKSITFVDTTTWYRTTSITNWQNKTNGTNTTVTTPSTNAIYFTSTARYYNYYWYKL